MPHILVFAAFFFILTLLFERFITWLEGKSEQTTPVQAKLASAHLEDDGEHQGCRERKPHQSATHLWQRILPDFIGGRKTFFKAAVIMAICWLPYYVLAFPEQSGMTLRAAGASMGREDKHHYQWRVVRSTPGVRHPDFRTVLSTWRLCGFPGFRCRSLHDGNHRHIHRRAGIHSPLSCPFKRQ